MDHKMSRKCSWFILWVIGSQPGKVFKFWSKPGKWKPIPSGSWAWVSGMYRGMQVRTSQLSITKFKRSSIRRTPTIQSRSPKFMRWPHFVGDFLCRRSCFNLQLSSESSCKAPSFYVWKTWGHFSDNFCDCFVFRVCFGFRDLFRGGGSKNLWKIELDCILGIPFGIQKKNLYKLYSNLERSLFGAFDDALEEVP